MYIMFAEDVGCICICCIAKDVLLVVFVDEIDHIAINREVATFQVCFSVKTSRGDSCGTLEIKIY